MPFGIAFGIADPERLYAELEAELRRLAPHASLNQKLTYCLWCCRSITDTLGDELSFAIGSEDKTLLDDVNHAIQGYLFRQEDNTKAKLEEYGPKFESLALETPDDKAGYEQFLCVSAVDSTNCSAALINLFFHDDDNELVVLCAMALIMIVETDVCLIEKDPAADEKIIQLYNAAKGMAYLMLQNDITEDRFENSVLVITRGRNLHDKTQLRLGVRG